MHTLKPQGNRNKRQNTRHPYSGCVFYATKNRIYEGQLKNYSLGGLFIKTHELLPMGEVITLALPYSKDCDEKRKAQIVRFESQGFGAEFFKDPLERIMRLDLF